MSRVKIKPTELPRQLQWCGRISNILVKMLNKEILDNSEIQIIIILNCRQITPGLQLRVTNIHMPVHVKSCPQIPAREKKQYSNK